MGVWRICEWRRQTGCRIGLPSENGGGNSTAGKKNNPRMTKTQTCRQASFSFLSQGLKTYRTMCWKIGTIGSAIYLLSFRVLMFSWRQRHKCSSCCLTSSLIAFVVSWACAKSCCCGCIVGIPHLCSPGGQCGGLLWFLRGSGEWHSHEAKITISKEKHLFIDTCFCTYVLRCLTN